MGWWGGSDRTSAMSDTQTGKSFDAFVTRATPSESAAVLEQKLALHKKVATTIRTDALIVLIGTQLPNPAPEIAMLRNIYLQFAKTLRDAVQAGKHDAELLNASIMLLLQSKDLAVNAVRMPSALEYIMGKTPEKETTATNATT